MLGKAIKEQMASLSLNEGKKEETTQYEDKFDEILHDALDELDELKASGEKEVNELLKKVFFIYKKYERQYINKDPELQALMA